MKNSTEYLENKVKEISPKVGQNSRRWKMGEKSSKIREIVQKSQQSTNKDSRERKQQMKGRNLSEKVRKCPKSDGHVSR